MSRTIFRDFFNHAPVTSNSDYIDFPHSDENDYIKKGNNLLNKKFINHSINDNNLKIPTDIILGRLGYLFELRQMRPQILLRVSTFLEKSKMRFLN